MINMDVTGTGALAQHLAEIEARALDPTPAFLEITDRICAAEKRLFASKTRLKPDKPATVAREARDKRSTVRANAATPLKATGRLEQFLTTRGPDAQPVKLSHDELVFGVPASRSDLHYARYQAKYGRDPLVSRATVRAIAQPVLADFIAPA